METDVSPRPEECQCPWEDVENLATDRTRWRTLVDDDDDDDEFIHSCGIFLSRECCIIQC